MDRACPSGGGEASKDCESRDLYSVSDSTTPACSPRPAVNSRSTWKPFWWVLF